MRGSDRNLNNTCQLGLVPITDTITIEDNITSIINRIPSFSTVYLTSKTIIVAKADSGTTNIYWIKQDTSIPLDVNHRTNGATVQLPNNYIIPATHTSHLSLPLSIYSTTPKPIYLMDSILPH